MIFRPAPIGLNVCDFSQSEPYNSLQVPKIDFTQRNRYFSIPNLHGFFVLPPLPPRWR